MRRCRSHSQSALLAVTSALSLASCDDFDDSWTEIVITAEPVVVGPDAELGYCIWDEATGAADFGPMGLRPVRDNPCVADESTAPLPGTLVIRNGARTERELEGRFQLEVASGGEECRQCPPSLGTIAGAARLCLVAAGPIRLSRLDRPRYHVSFSSAGGQVVSLDATADAGVDLPPCE